MGISVGQQESSCASEEKAIKAEFNLIFIAHINDCFELKLTLIHKDIYTLNLGCYLYRILHNKNNDCFAQ